MAQFPPEQYTPDATYILSNGYYIDFKRRGPELAAVTRTPEGAVWNEGDSSFAAGPQILVEEAILNLPLEFGDVELIKIIQKEKPPPPKKNIQFNILGRVLNNQGDPIKNATIKAFLFEKPQPPPPTPNAGGADPVQYANAGGGVGEAISMAPISVDEGGRFLIEYWKENEIDFKQSYIEIKADKHFPKSVGPTLTKTGEKSVEKSVAESSTPDNNDTVSYRYITGFTFDNNGNASGVEVIVENNAGLPEFTKNFSSVTFTPESAKTQVKNMMDAAGDYVNGVQYPKTGTSLNADPIPQDPPSEKEDVMIDIYDLGKVVLQPEEVNLDKETAELKTQIQEGENRVLAQIAKRGLGFEVKMVALFSKQKENLKQIMLPKILGIISSFGPAIVNSLLAGKKNALDDSVCPDPEKVIKAIQKRNKLVRDLNRTYKIVRTISKILKITNAVIIGLKVGLTIVQTLTTIPTTPLTPFGLKAFYSGLTEKGFKVMEKTLEKSGIAVTALSIIAGCVGVVLGAIIDLLNKLDFMLQKCAEKPAPVLDPVTGEMVVKPIPFETINNELNTFVDSTTGETEDIIDPETGNPFPYKGFTFEIKTDTSQDFQYPKRYAIARNVQGIQVLRSESSFASAPEVLIEELKFVIDRDNLRAD